jgi:hypothetical protein
MFRRVREAARRGRTQAKGLLARAGRGAATAAVYTGRGLRKVWTGVRTALTYTARAVSWVWMGAVEIESMGWAPLTWIFGNVLFAVLRGGETLINKVFRRESTNMQRRAPAFTLLNAVAIDNIIFYPLVAIVGWVLSPLSGKNWWRTVAHGYKTRTLSAADREYYDRFAYDLAYDKTMGDETVWEAATESVTEPPAANVDVNGLTAIQAYEQNLANGYSMVWPDANAPEGHRFDYLRQRVAEQGTQTDLNEFDLSLNEDHWGRWWVMLPDGVSTQRPPKQPFFEEPHPKHAAEEPAEPEMTEEEAERRHAESPHIERDVHGLINYDITNPPDFEQISDPKEKSFWYGARFAAESSKQIKNFLGNEKLQNRARMAVANDAKNPQSEFLLVYVLKGFEAELDRAKEAATHHVS